MSSGGFRCGRFTRAIEQITANTDHEQLSDFCNIQVHIVVGVDYFNQRNNISCFGNLLIVTQPQPSHVPQRNFACAVLVDLFPSPPGIQI